MAWHNFGLGAGVWRSSGAVAIMANDLRYILSDLCIAINEREEMLTGTGTLWRHLPGGDYKLKPAPTDFAGMSLLRTPGATHGVLYNLIVQMRTAIEGLIPAVAGHYRWFLNATAAKTNTVQVITIICDVGAPTGGTFTLTWNGSTTDPLAYNASPAVVQSALEDLAGLTGNVTVTGTNPWVVTFTGDLAGQDVSEISGSALGITGVMIYPHIEVIKTAVGGEDSIYANLAALLDQGSFGDAWVDADRWQNGDVWEQMREALARLTRIKTITWVTAAAGKVRDGDWETSIADAWSGQSVISETGGYNVTWQYALGDESNPGKYQCASTSHGKSISGFLSGGYDGRIERTLVGFYGRASHLVQTSASITYSLIDTLTLDPAETIDSLTINPNTSFGGWHIFEDDYRVVGIAADLDMETMPFLNVPTWDPVNEEWSGGETMETSYGSIWSQGTICVIDVSGALSVG